MCNYVKGESSSLLEIGEAASSVLKQADTATKGQLEPMLKLLSHRFPLVLVNISLSGSSVSLPLSSMFSFKLLPINV